jgi:hypothetical protein
MNHQLVHPPIWTRALFLLLLLSLPGVAAANDQVGIYFDDYYENYSLNVPEANTIVTGYLVLKDPSTPHGIAGWELCVDLDGPATFLSWQLEGQIINVLEEPCFQVGVGDAPLPGGDQVLLATFTVLVQDLLPVTFSVGPITHESIPGEMAYLANSDPLELHPMFSATGEPEVAWINQYVPYAVIDPPYVNFGVIPLTYTEERLVTVYNTGGGPLVLNVEIFGGDGVFHLTSVQGPHTVQAGQSLPIPLLFQPTAVQPYEGALTFGNPIAEDVPLQGEGREPILAWDVVPELDFGEVPIGDTANRQLIISNIGEVPFPIEPVLPAGCTAFSILNPAPGVVVAPGSQAILNLAFTPDVEGPVSCELSLGSVVDSVTLLGSAHQPIMSYSVDPEYLVFPPVAVGNLVARNILLTNTGEGIFHLDINLVEPSGEFGITNGFGIQTLPPGDSMYITVQFIPSDIGEFSTEVTFGHDLISNVPVTGTGIDANMSCLVTPEHLDFGPMILGGIYTQHFTVLNDGNIQLVVVPDALCNATTITPAEAFLQPGESQTFSVAHLAQELGAWECLIVMGQSACSDVTCSGMVNSGPAPDENRVGLFFDDDFTQFEIDFHTAGVLETHLVLMNPTDPDGISGWECRLEIVGDLCFLLQSDLMGQALNFATPPEYLVGLGTPMPWAPALHLATFHLFIADPNQEIYLHLFPLNNPSIPNEMAWLTADMSQIIPMISHTGSPLVAYININPLAVQAPAPEVALNGQSVQLTWDVQDNSSNSYLVYRRGETGVAELLFEQPMTADGGRFVYRDYPVGFADGTSLHYSYAVLQDGVEVARSPETDIVLSGMPQAVTRLLPNVPNPFNPMTEINFELELAGQVRVSVYDVSGRLVNVLVNEQLSSGPHSRIWQGKDQGGRQVPSGTYYLRMETASRIDHRKVMLLK